MEHVGIRTKLRWKPRKQISIAFSSLLLLQKCEYSKPELQKAVVEHGEPVPLTFSPIFANHWPKRRFTLILGVLCTFCAIFSEAESTFFLSTLTSFIFTESTFLLIRTLFAFLFKTELCLIYPQQYVLKDNTATRLIRAEWNGQRKYLFLNLKTSTSSARNENLIPFL